MLDFWGKPFHKAKFIESIERRCNPDRGMYQMFTMILGEETDYQKFESCLVDLESLIFLMIDISAYRDAELPERELQNINEAIEFFVSRGKDVILRVVYDHSGDALKYEPALFRQVKEHLTQITTLIADHPDSIFVYQGLLVGNWGEMHTSKYLGKTKMKELLEILDEGLAGKVFLALRRPCFYRQLREELPDRQSADKCKLGLYDDAILGSESDMGTFGDSNSDGMVWENAWKRELELDFVDRQCSVAPCGGEAVLGDRFMNSLSPKDITENFRKMHLTYLNRLYDQKMLDYWRGIKYPTEGVFKGCSLYDYIEAHLGYRYLVTDTNVSVDSAGAGSKIKVDIAIANTGFANMYREGQAMLTVRDEKTGKEQEYCLGRLNRIGSGETGEYMYMLGARTEKGGKMSFYLWAKRAYDERKIYYGNHCEKDGKVYLGYLTGYRIDEVVS